MRNMKTHTFNLKTSARPAQVWEAVTRPELIARYLYGLRLESDWLPGSKVTGDLSGDVLAAEEGKRLSFTVAAPGAGQPETYVTWEIEDGLVRLSIDENDDDPESEAAWSVALDALHNLLLRAATGS